MRCRWIAARRWPSLDAGAAVAVVGVAAAEAVVAETAVGRRADSAAAVTGIPVVAPASTGFDDALEEEGLQVVELEQGALELLRVVVHWQRLATAQLEQC